MKLLQTLDGIIYEMVPASEKAEIEKSAHKIKEIVTYINKMTKYSECAGKCPIILKIKSLAGQI